MQGLVQQVNTIRLGGFPIARSAAGTSTLYFEDAADFEESGGEVEIDGVIHAYVSADLDLDTVLLAAPLPSEVTEDDFVAVYPRGEQTWASVAFGDDVFEVEVPHALKAFLPEGIRDEGDEEAVILSEGVLGYDLVDVVGRQASMDARHIDNAEELLLENQTTLGEKLAENDVELEAARGRLTEAEGRLADAFTEIDILPDSAYVDAAKQQAIDAAAIDAQQKADAAETDAKSHATAIANFMYASAQQDLANAETDLQAAIASGDAAAIADAEAKIAVAKAAAIDAAADDAAAKASAAQAAAEQAAQAALAQAESDLQQAIASGDAAAIADAEAKIATAKSEAITAAANDATAKAAEAMQKANAALTAAQSAQATADNAIRTYYAETPPWASGTTQPDDVLGDMWYKDSTGQAYRWNGTEWKVIQDASIGEALAAAANAQTTADGKITAFYQPNEPLEADEGDLWFDTDNDSAIHRRTGDQWVALLDPKALADAAEQAAKTAAAADATAKAEAAEAAAVQAAAADAQAKADAAEAAAEAAAKTYSDTVASGASQAAIDAAAADAQAKADAARDAAIAAAELDATAKAEAAEAAAAATAAADATAKADAAQAAAIAAAEAAENRALSRGTDLVTNGTGYLKNNYNFGSLTFTTADAPVGSSGSFVSTSGTRIDGNTGPMSVDPNKSYRLSISARTVEGAPSTGGLLYTNLWFYDAYGSPIGLTNIHFRVGSTTTLAQPLNPGDTVMYLTDASGWDNTPNAPVHLRVAKFWDYVDPGGRAWPPETYTRNQTSNNFYVAGGINVGTGAVTLSSAYSGPAKAAGTPVSNGSNASSRFYTAWNAGRPSTEWETRTATLSGLASPANGNAMGNTSLTPFPPGAASVAIGWMTNYNPKSGHNMAIAGVSLSDASAAQETADQALSDAETKSEAAKQAAIAAAAADATAKAEAAEAAAAATAAADATAKANQAKADAEAAAKAYTDALDTGASDADIAAARTYAEQQAEAARVAAEQAAAADATAKAEAAEAAAAATAAADATAKANAAKQAAIDAAAADATAKADQAREDAKAFATTTANGLAKTFWSTALPGTTKAPQNSTWYQHANNKIISVFTQTAAGSQGSTWSARPITSEAIDNLDVGKITGASGTINDLVANLFAAKLANIIQANIGNLTVTGDTHLNSVVAQQIWGDIASFAELTADKVLAGDVQAVWNIIAGGKIVSGDPNGARVELGSYPNGAGGYDFGIRVYSLGFNGVPYEAVSMIGGKVAFAVVDQTRGRLGGISSEGDVTGQTGAFAKRLTYKGVDVVGTLDGVSAAPGYMDLLPRGVMPGSMRTSATVGSATSGETRGLASRASLKAGRRYRVRGSWLGKTSVSAGVIRLRLRYTTDGTLPTLSSPDMGAAPFFQGYTVSVSVGGDIEGLIAPAVDMDFVALLTHQGMNGSTAQKEWSQLYIEDVGPRGLELEGGDGDTPKTVYTTTWRATASRGYTKAGATISNKENEIDLWYFGANNETAENAAILFGGTAYAVDQTSENGRTLPQALNGATVHSATLEITNAMWWNEEHRSMAFNTLSAASLPSTKVIEGSSIALIRDIPEGATTRVDLDPAWFTNGTNRGVTVGDKDGSLSGVQMGAGKFQGPNDPDAPLLTIVYSR